MIPFFTCLSPKPVYGVVDLIIAPDLELSSVPTLPVFSWRPSPTSSTFRTKTEYVFYPHIVTINLWPIHHYPLSKLLLFCYLYYIQSLSLYQGKNGSILYNEICFVLGPTFSVFKKSFTTKVRNGIFFSIRVDDLFFRLR